MAQSRQGNSPTDVPARKGNSTDAAGRSSDSARWKYSVTEGPGLMQPKPTLAVMPPHPPVSTTRDDEAGAQVDAIAAPVHGCSSLSGPNSGWFAAMTSYLPGRTVGGVQRDGDLDLGASTARARQR